MITLEKPFVTQGILYLQDTEDAMRLWTVPAPPTVLPVGVEPEISLVLYRFPLQQKGPRGGASLHISLDLNAPTLETDQAEIQLRESREEILELSPLAIKGGTLSLQAFGKRISTEEIQTGIRSVVAMSTSLDVEEASLFHKATKQEKVILSAIVDGEIEVHNPGPELRIKADPAACLKALGEIGHSFEMSDIGTLTQRLVETGHIQVSVNRQGDVLLPETWSILAASLARFFFTPVADLKITWSGVPGVSNRGCLTLKKASSEMIELVIPAGGPVLIAWFAQAPLPPILEDSLELVDAPGSGIRSIDIIATRQDADNPVFIFTDVDLELAPGNSRTVRLEPGRDRRKVYYLPPPNDRTYRFRYRAQRRDGVLLESEWREADWPLLVIDVNPGERRLTIITILFGSNLDLVQILVDLELTPDNSQTVELEPDNPDSTVFYFLPPDGNQTYRWRYRTKQKNGPDFVSNWEESDDWVLIIS
jgi:hypothetical protein